MHRELSQQLRRYYRTPRWRDISYAVKKRDGWKCRACNRKMHKRSWRELWTVKVYLTVHHLNYENWRIEPGTEPLDDLVTLCGSHHEEVHSRFDSGKYETLAEATWDVIDRCQRKIARERQRMGLPTRSQSQATAAASRPGRHRRPQRDPSRTIR